MSGMEKWKHLLIPFADIKTATIDFKKEIGKGGYGLVYEGNLLINGSYLKVAVKRLNEKYGQGLKEFLNEIDLLSGQHHQNLITLVGYCDEEKEKIIVYEFAERGSLDIYFKFRNPNFSLTWVERLKIVVDAARGLNHLHNGLEKNHVIIHRDIKSSNILLDENWVAKVSDFGLSKSTFVDSGSGNSTFVTRACGTPGYVEPELAQTFMVSKRSDVYSFGMVLFEVLCGRLCNRSYEDGITLSAEIAEKYYADCKLDMIIDPVLKEQMSPDSLRKFSAIAINCLKPRGQRPLMDAVKKELEETLVFQIFQSTPMQSMSGMKSNLFKIPFAEIKDATKDFTTVIGRGAYGSMYKGELRFHGIYKKIAVKRLSGVFGQGIREFLTEIQLLLGEHHENIITLVGYCDDGKEKIIVYEYAENGSLDRYIMGRDTSYTLTWLQRLKIVADAARGLDHLHNHLQNNEVIIHRDIKSSNILLDHKWVAKISDFGLSKSKFSGLDRSTVFTNPWGTHGYAEPEYNQTGFVSKKSDVYSFGVVLFEVLCGRLGYIIDKDGKMLARVAKECYANDQLDMIIDPILKEQISPDSLRKYSAIAYKCLQDRTNRPLMDVVKKELEEALNIEVRRWRNFISKHWFILDVENLSSKTDTEMQDEETEE